MGGSQDKVEAKIINALIETIFNDLQERLKAHEKHLTGKGFKMGEFVYTSFGDIKDEFLKEMPWGGFRIFVDAWYLCAFCNIDYTSKSYFLEMGKKVVGVGFKSSGELHLEITFYQ